MFGFIRKLFGRKSQPQTAYPSEPARKISSVSTSQFESVMIPYRAELIPSLKDDHQQLLGLYGTIMQAAEDKDFEKLNATLKEFKTELKDHLAEEFKDLYVFVEYFASKNSPADKAQVRDFKNEMQMIGGKVMGILNKYNDMKEDSNELEALIEDFKGMGAILVDRIEREEAQLYPLYDKYGDALLGGDNYRSALAFS